MVSVASSLISWLLLDFISGCRTGLDQFLFGLPKQSYFTKVYKVGFHCERDEVMKMSV